MPRERAPVPGPPEHERTSQLASAPGLNQSFDSCVGVREHGQCVKCASKPPCYHLCHLPHYGNLERAIVARDPLSFPTSEAAGLNQSKRFKILVVDDDTPTRMLLKSVVGKQGYDLIEAADGERAVALFESERPDLVLLDVMMPIMNGYVACARIRTLDNGEGTPVVMLTAADDIDAIEAAFTAGATDFITKPISWPLLIQRVRYALRGGTLTRELRQNRLQQASARLIAKLGFWEWHPDDGRLSWSDDLQLLLGVRPQAITTVEHLINHVHRDDRNRVRRNFLIPPLQGERFELEVRFKAGNEERIVRMVGERGNEGSDHDRVFGAFQDVTDSRRAEALVDYLAFHDDLTGLANRRLFIREVREALLASEGIDGQTLLVGWIDITRFHRHNEALGEAVGDMLLTLVAKRLRAMAPENTRIARVGGDEFAVMLSGHGDEDALNRLKMLLECLNAAFVAGRHETFLTFSAGFASFPGHGSDAEQLLLLAQEAQRKARSQGRQVAVAMPDGGKQSSKALDIEHALRRALENKEFHLVYQPQMDLRLGRIVGVEALLRWHHPERGLIPPVQFIPLLEEIGLISVVGNWVLEAASRQAAAWAQAGTPLRVGVNLSPRQFVDPELFSQVCRATRTAQLSNDLLELEITESLAMQDPDHSIDILDRFRRQGFHIAIDDFGIGHSSLEYLLRFPIDAIKIDRAFVINITANQADRAIVRAVTAIGQTLGLKIIAEGVETLRQCDFIEALGVTEIQGYLIGKPMLPVELNQLLDCFVRPGQSA